jgi:hypothetical protein
LLYQAVVQNIFQFRGAHVLCDLIVSLNGYDALVAGQLVDNLWKSLLDTGCEFSELIKNFDMVG